MVKTAILGATGYGGVELVRLLHGHPQVELAYLSSETYAGKRIGDVYPHLAAVEGVLSALDPAAAAGCDFALLALPAGKSMEMVPELLKGGTRVIDVSPDFRLDDPEAYRAWYGEEHSQPGLLSEAVCGLPEWHRAGISDARLVAAPGCYTTAAVLALAPVVADGLIDPSDIVVDGKSGVSGAGRTSLKLPYHFPEANEDAAAYAVGGHRHMAEMAQHLQALTERPVRTTFTPHLVAMTRGILVTCYVRPVEGANAEALRESLRRRYEGEAFVHVMPAGEWVHTKWTQGTNLCFLAVEIDPHSGRGIVLSAIDNLGKGMSGQMVQCLNLMLGVDEGLALRIPAVYP